MKKLLKEYDFTSVSEYFEMIVESVINGQRTQAKDQFKAMPKDNQKEFVKNFSQFSLEERDKNMFIDLL